MSDLSQVCTCGPAPTIGKEINSSYDLHLQKGNFIKEFYFFISIPDLSLMWPGHICFGFFSSRFEVQNKTLTSLSDVLVGGKIVLSCKMSVIYVAILCPFIPRIDEFIINFLPLLLILLFC